MNEKSRDTAILAVSFGTSYHKTREATIGAIEKKIADMFPQYQVRRAFTSQMIINKLAKRDGIYIDNEAQSLKRAAEDGIKYLIVQPTHLMNGTEYHDLKRDVEEHQELFEGVSLGEPLLTDETDFDRVIEAVTEDTAEYSKEGTAILFMGHGTGAEANHVYFDLQDKLKEQGYHNYYIATVEAEPTLEDVIPLLKEQGYTEVVLQPLMIVAGDHATNDMAGDEEDSWKTILTGEGFAVKCVLKGLGEIEKIREIFADHAREAEEKLRR